MPRSLTSRASIDLLKQEAKRWLAAIRRGDPSALARLATAWPAAPPAPGLRDVQHALAREYGHQDWVALSAAVTDQIADRQTADQRIEAVLRHGWGGDVALARRIVARHPAVRDASIFTAAATGAVERVARLLAADPGLARAIDRVRQWTALAHVAYGRLDADHAVAIATLLLDAGADAAFAFDDGYGNPHSILTGIIGHGEQMASTHPHADELVTLCLARGADPFDPQLLYNASLGPDDPHWLERLWTECAARDGLEPWRRVKGTALGGRFPMNALDFLLGAAVARNHLRRATWLLEHGAQASTLHAYSGQPVHTEARLAGFGDMLALLEAHGATAEPLQGERALRAAVMRGDEASVRAAVAADPSVVRHPALLIGVASRGNAQGVTLLLSLGADVSVRDHQGATPLHRAVQSGSVATVAALLAGGADIDARDQTWHATPLGWASYFGQDELAAELAQTSQDVRTLAHQGMVERLAEVLDARPGLVNERLATDPAPTPVFCLPNDEDLAHDVAALLRARGADLAVRDRAGRTPAEAARARGLERAASALA